MQTWTDFMATCSMVYDRDDGGTKYTLVGKNKYTFLVSLREITNGLPTDASMVKISP